MLSVNEYRWHEQGYVEALASTRETILPVYETTFTQNHPATEIGEEHTETSPSCWFAIDDRGVLNVRLPDQPGLVDVKLDGLFAIHIHALGCLNLSIHTRVLLSRISNYFLILEQCYNAFEQLLQQGHGLRLTGACPLAQQVIKIWAHRVDCLRLCVQNLSFAAISEPLTPFTLERETPLLLDTQASPTMRYQHAASVNYRRSKKMDRHALRDQVLLVQQQVLDQTIHHHAQHNVSQEQVHEEEDRQEQEEQMREQVVSGDADFDESLGPKSMCRVSYNYLSQRIKLLGAWFYQSPFHYGVGLDRDDDRKATDVFLTEKDNATAGFFLKSIYTWTLLESATKSSQWLNSLPGYSFDYIAKEGLHTVLPFTKVIEDGLNPNEVSVYTQSYWGLFSRRYLLRTHKTDAMLARIASTDALCQPLPRPPQSLLWNADVSMSSQSGSGMLTNHGFFNQVYLLLLHVGGGLRIPRMHALYRAYYMPWQTEPCPSFLDDFLNWIEAGATPGLYADLVALCREWLHEALWTRDEVRVLLDPFLRQGVEGGEITPMLRCLLHCLTLFRATGFLASFYQIGLRDAQTAGSLGEVLVTFAPNSQECSPMLRARMIRVQPHSSWWQTSPAFVEASTDEAGMPPSSAAILLLELSWCVMRGQKDRQDPMVQFTEHFLRYVAYHRVKLTAATLDELFARYHRLTQLWCLTPSVDERKRLERLFLNSILSSEHGLSVKAVKLDLTLFESLETLFQHAVKQHRLDDQLACLAGLSLAWRDVPYALHEKFIVVSAEMQLEHSRLNFYGHYEAPTRAMLQSACLGAIEDAVLFNKTLFSYLGRQPLARPVSEYRQLASILANTQPSDPDLDLRLLSIYALLTAEGAPANAVLLETKMYETISEWFASNPLAVTLRQRWQHVLPDIQRLLCVETNHVSLWQLYQEYGFRHSGSSISSLLGSMIGLFRSSATVLPPPILTCFFKRELLSDFVQSRWLDLEKEDAFLSKQAPDFPMAMLKALVPLSTNDPHIIRDLTQWIEQAHQTLSLTRLRQQFQGFERTMAAYVTCMSQPQAVGLQKVLKTLMFAVGLSRTVLAWQLFEEWAQRLNVCDELPLKTVFFHTLAQDAVWLTHADDVLTREAMHVWTAFYLRHRPDEALLSGLLKACNMAMQTLQPLQSMTMLLDTAHDMASLWRQSVTLTVLQVQNITALLQRTKRAVPFVLYCLEHDPKRTFAPLMPYLTLSRNGFEAALLLIEHFLRMGGQLTAKNLKHLCERQERVLVQAARWWRGSNPEERRQQHAFLMDFFKAESDELLLDELDNRYQSRRSKQETLLPVLSWDEPAIRHELSQQLVFESTDAIGHERLYASLFGVQALMTAQTPRFPTLTSEATERPDRPVCTFESLPRSLHMLAPNEGYRLYQQCCEILRSPLMFAQRMAVLEALLAFCCSVMYEETEPHQFPRPLQCAAVLNACWHDQTSTLHELPTGSGKSMVIALMVALDYACGQAPDIVTQNRQLADDALRLYGAFYRRLGIAVAEEPITAEDVNALYRRGQVHVMTVEDRVFFEVKQKISASPVLLNQRLLMDEAHLVLTTTVACNLAIPATNVTVPGDIDWDWVLLAVMAFVQDKELFLDNLCSPADDRCNVQQYVQSSLLQRGCAILSIQTWLSTMTDDIWDELLESARIASVLVENEDVVPLEKEDGLTYAAPVLAQTHRPCLTVSFGGYIQAFLQQHFKQVYPESAWFPVVRQEVVLSLHPSVLFRWAKRHVVAFTGTAGDTRAVRFFEHAHGVKTMRYQANPTSTVTRYPAVSAPGVTAHTTLLVERVLAWHQQHPEHAMLVFLNDPKAVYRLRDALHAAGLMEMGLYEGYDRVGSVERDMIKQAGQVGRITLTTPAWSCGVDIQPESVLTVIIGCTMIDALSLRQIEGRTGRNQRQGHVLYVLDEDDITPGSDSMEDRWRQQCQRWLEMRQDQLEATHRFYVLYHVVMIEHFLQQINVMQAIFLPWHGVTYSLVKRQREDTLLLHGIDPALMRWISGLHHRLFAIKSAYLREGAAVLPALMDDCNAHWVETFKPWWSEPALPPRRPITWTTLTTLGQVQGLSLKDWIAMSQWSQALESVRGYEHSEPLKQIVLPCMVEAMDAFFAVYSTLLHGQWPSREQIRTLVMKSLLAAELGDATALSESILKITHALTKLSEANLNEQTNMMCAALIAAVNAHQWDVVWQHVEGWIIELSSGSNVSGGMAQVKTIVAHLMEAEDPMSLPLKQVLDLIDALCQPSLLVEVIDTLLAKQGGNLSSASSASQAELVLSLMRTPPNAVQQAIRTDLSEAFDQSLGDIQRRVLLISTALREHQHAQLRDYFDIDRLAQIILTGFFANSSMSSFMSTVSSPEDSFGKRMMLYFASKISPLSLWKGIRVLLPKGPKATILFVLRFLDSTVGWVPLILSWLHPSARTHTMKVAIRFLLKAIYGLLESDISLTQQRFGVMLDAVETFWEDAGMDACLREWLPNVKQHEMVSSRCRKTIQDLRHRYGDQSLDDCLQPGHVLQILTYILDAARETPRFPDQLKRTLRPLVEPSCFAALLLWDQMTWPSFVALVYAMSHPSWILFLQSWSPDTPLALILAAMDELADSPQETSLVAVDHTTSDELQSEQQESIPRIASVLPITYGQLKVSFWAKTTGFSVEEIQQGIEMAQSSCR